MVNSKNLIQGGRKNKAKFVQKNYQQKFIIFLIALLMLFFPYVSFAQSSNHTFPRKANYFLNWNLNESQARQLANWDLVILDMEVQVRASELLKKMRAWNPQIVILAYITPQEIIQTGGMGNSIMRQRLAGGIPDVWYLKNSQGEKMTWWSGTYLLNVTNDCPLFNGQRFNQYLTRFVNNEILVSGLWDGVFYDNTWDSVTHFIGKNVDTDSNGVINDEADAKWREGMKFIYNETRRLAGDYYILVGNGTTREYKNELNGKMMENFFVGAWSPIMNTYANNFATGQNPKINIINANTANTGSVDLQKMRLGLTSSLLEDGYFSYDYGDQNHGQTWWYDEYNVNLGAPVGPAKSLNNYNTYKADIWRRDFGNGLVIVNSTGENKTVDLGGDYEKIKGTQDSKVNNGAIVSQTVIDGYDGLILLKTVATLEDVLFRNGDFVRFFGQSGNRLRNGFFIFEGGYQGGDKIAHTDLNNNGARDLVVISGTKLMGWRDDAQVLFRIFPYTANYKGELRAAIGDVNGDGLQEIVVAPSAGYSFPLKVYSYYGELLKDNFFPFGDKYSGGYSLALGTSLYNNLVIGKQTQEPLLAIFDLNYKMARQWLAYAKGSKFGVNVALGDVNGDKAAELVVGAGAGAKPLIRIFDKAGKQLYNEITAYKALGNPGTEVLSVDINYDGVEDIVSMGSSF